jgi:DNA primase
LIKYWRSPLFSEEIAPNKEGVVTVSQYLFQEFEDDKFVSVNPFNQKMIDEMEENLMNADFDCQRHFTTHPDIQICQLATNLLAEKNVESVRWEKNGSWVEGEEEILPTLVPKAVEEYKLTKALLLATKLEKEMEQAQKEGNIDKAMELQMEYMNLKKVITILSESLDRVINQIK